MNKTLTKQDVDRIIEMAWEDRTPFEAIQYQFNLAEKDIKLMRNELKLSSRSGESEATVPAKNMKKRSNEINRFKCSRQVYFKKK